MPNQENQNISRRTVIKRFKHVLLGSATAYLTLTKSYHKPSLTKMNDLYDAAAMADSVVGACTCGGEGEDGGCDCAHC
jgi:hypothetical protein